MICTVLSCRATSNHKVKETVALELSYVNSNLQLLKEELEELNSSVDVYQNDRYMWQAAAFAVGRAACSAGILFSLLLFCFCFLWEQGSLSICTCLSSSLLCTGFDPLAGTTRW